MAVAPNTAGGNPSGFNVSGLPAISGMTPIGSNPFGSSNANPMMAPWPGGTAMPQPGQAFGANGTPGALPGNPFGIPADPWHAGGAGSQDPALAGGSGKPGGGGGGGVGNALLTALNPIAGIAHMFGSKGANKNLSYKDALAKGLHSAGYPSAVADALSVFIVNGAGYNSDVLNGLMAQLQPQISRGQADIMERFGSMGQGMGSAAAIGMGDFMSQVNLNEMNMATQLYEQSIQNYMNIMTGQNAKKQPSQAAQGLGSLVGGAGGLLQGVASLAMV